MLAIPTVVSRSQHTRATGKRDGTVARIGICQRKRDAGLQVTATERGLHESALPSKDVGLDIAAEGASEWLREDEAWER